LLLTLKLPPVELSTKGEIDWARAKRQHNRTAIAKMKSFLMSVILGRMIMAERKAQPS